MDNFSRGTIRKLIYGSNPKDSLGISVGFKSESTGLTVTEIVQDKNYLAETGREKFIILVKNTQNVEFVWKEIISVAVVIEYSNPKEELVNII